MTYRYVGPQELRAAQSPEAVVVQNTNALHEWLTIHIGESVDPFTFVIDPTGSLRLAPRRSEHVACAGGGQVLAAGEITFAHHDDSWSVSAISNQSTGYCPDVTCWAAVAAALHRLGITHPAGFTHPVVFRRCPECSQINIVREEMYVCAVCDADLPLQWNLHIA